VVTSAKNQLGGTREEILKVIREVVAPLVRADGGQIYLVRAEDDAVNLHLTGRVAGCPGTTLATRRVIAPAIFAVAPGAKVTISSGPLIPPGAERIGP
jgi:Fe-S cluster biogenesis protein NfuA